MDKGRCKGLSLGIAFAVCHQHADAPYAVALLRAHREGPAAAAPLTSLMNSRRLIFAPEAQDKASSRLKLAHFKGPQPMSALGHKRTCAAQKAMSALTPKADMCSAQADVRFVPIADIKSSLSPGQHRRGREAISDHFFAVLHGTVRRLFLRAEIRVCVLQQWRRARSVAISVRA